MGKIRVLYIHHGQGNDGATISLLHLLKALDLNRYESIVATDVRFFAARNIYRQEGIPIVDVSIAPFEHVWPSGWWPLYYPRGLVRFMLWLFIRFPRSVRSFIKALDDVRPDIVHLNSLVLAPLAFFARRKGVRVVLHVRESVITGSCGVRMRWLRWLANACCDWVIYICRDNQDKLTGQTGRSSVVYNPVSFNQFDRNLDGEQVRKELSISLDSTVLFFPGGSSAEPKGIIPFLRALAVVRQTYNDICAIIPGIDRPVENRREALERKRIENELFEHSLDDIVLRLPFLNEVQRYFAASDVVVCPFVVPHFSRAIIEAGALKKPVVGSRIGGIIEVVEDGVTGFLAEPDDVRDIADKLLKLIENKEKCELMGLAGYENTRAYFGAETHGRAVMDVYNRIVAPADEDLGR